MIDLLDKLLNLIFPTVCVVCDTTGPDICTACLMDFTEPKPQNYGWTTSLWNYRDPQVATLLRYLKNNPNYRAAKIIAVPMIKKLQIEVSRNSEFAQIHNAIIIPVPIGRARWIERGYNQSVLLAHPIAKMIHRELHENILIKSKQTKKQGTAKSKQERLENIIGSFAVTETAADYVRGRDIIIVDDITTTGATLFEARKTLLAAGARRVVAITIAN